MLTARLNPTLQRELRLKYSSSTGLQCVLDLTSISLRGRAVPVECERYLRIEEGKHRRRAEKAVVRVQCLFRGTKARMVLRRLKEEKEFRRRVAAAIVIQRYSRGKLARNKRKLLYAVAVLMRVREAAAVLIQRRYRTFQQSFQTRVCRLLSLRHSAASRIQARCRGHLVRKDLSAILNHPRIHLLIRWRSQARSAYLAGSFTSPQWRILLPMKYSRYLGEFYNTFLMDTPMPSGKYYMKFVIEGQWVCDGHYLLEQDSKGQFNNVIIRPPDHTLMKKSASVHGLKRMEQSLNVQQLDVPLAFVRSNSGNLDQERVFTHERRRLVAKGAVRLTIAGFMVAHPKNPKMQLSSEGSSDAYFMNNEMQTFGLADGVGEWQHYGLNPSFYSNELMAHCDALLSRELQMVDSGYSTSPLSEVCRNVMEHAFRMTENYGSSTAIVTAFRENTLSFACLGDSGILILRVRDSCARSLAIIYRSVEQQHAFNCPFQLTHIPKPEEYESLKSMGLGALTKVLRRAGKIYQDSCTDACCDEIPLQEGDIVIAASDGLFDNLFDHDIASIAERLSSEEPVELFAAKLAQALTEIAVEKGWDSTYKSPFAKHAVKAGKSFIGGKLDDTTVIVAVARS